MKLATAISARVMEPGECIPENLVDAFTKMPSLDLNWVWTVVDESGTTVGLIVAAPCHGVAMILRVKTVEGAPSSALIVLLRKFFADVRKRGLAGFMTFLDANTDTEKRLLVLSKKIGGKIIGMPVCAVGSPLPPEGM